MKCVLAFALLFVGASAKQNRVTNWSCSNPLEGITKDCSSINQKKNCGMLKKGKYTGNFGCCRWLSSTNTCADRSCSFFDKNNCNAAPHCGWKYTTNGDDPESATGACEERASVAAGCDSMWKDTCDKYYMYCKWNPSAPGPSDSAIPDAGGCQTLMLPTTSNSGITGASCADKTSKKSCRWWQLKEGSNYCTWSAEAKTCYTTAYANAHCKWEKRSNCQKAINADTCVGSATYTNNWSGGASFSATAACSCKWIASKTKCVKYYEFPCFKLTGDDMNTQKRNQCCTPKQEGSTVRGAVVGTHSVNQITNAELNDQYGTNKCNDPKLGHAATSTIHHNCRWCQTQEESPRCTRAQNCPVNLNP